MKLTSSFGTIAKTRLFQKDKKMSTLRELLHLLRETLSVLISLLLKNLLGIEKLLGKDPKNHNISDKKHS